MKSLELLERRQTRITLSLRRAIYAGYTGDTTSEGDVNASQRRKTPNQFWGRYGESVRNQPVPTSYHQCC